jgi:hypothetical protein
MDLATLLEGMADKLDREPPARPSDTQLVAQVMDIRDLADRYAKGNPFKVGEVVTPRANAPVHGHATPHVVVEALDTPHWVYGEDSPSSSGWGRRIDIRTAYFSAERGFIALTWGESHDYEPYTGPMPDSAS